MIDKLTINEQYFDGNGDEIHVIDESCRIIEMRLTGNYSDDTVVKKDYSLKEEDKQTLLRRIRSVIGIVSRLGITLTRFTIIGESDFMDIGSIGSFSKVADRITIDNVSCSIPRDSVFNDLSLTNVSVTFPDLSVFECKTGRFNNVIVLGNDECKVQTEKFDINRGVLSSPIEFIGLNDKSSTLSLNDVSASIRKNGKKSFLSAKQFRAASLTDVELERFEDRPCVLFRNITDLNVSNISISDQGTQKKVKPVVRIFAALNVSVSDITFLNSDPYNYAGGIVHVTNTVNVYVSDIEAKDQSGVLVKSVRFEDKILPIISISNSKIKGGVLTCGSSAMDTKNTILELFISDITAKYFGSNIFCKRKVIFNNLRYWRAVENLEVHSENGISFNGGLVISPSINLIFNSKKVSFEGTQISVNKIINTGDVSFFKSRLKAFRLSGDSLSTNSGTADVKELDYSSKLIGNFHDPNLLS